MGRSTKDFGTTSPLPVHPPESYNSGNEKEDLVPLRPVKEIKASMRRSLLRLRESESIVRRRLKEAKGELAKALEEVDTLETTAKKKLGDLKRPLVF